MESENNLNVLENEHLTLFRETIISAIEESVSGLSENKFEELLKNISVIRKRTKSASNLIKIFKKNAITGSLSQLDDLLKEENLEVTFTAYSNFLKNNEGETKDVKWRPPGNVKEHLRPHLIQQKINIKQQLEQLVFEKESEVKNIQNDVILKRTQLKIFEKTFEELKKRNHDTAIHFEEQIEELTTVF
uniref:Uncharacterized protein n=1 Tax=Clastoptera arizonana TaxID=38151 RepID=A0A1B6DCU7_9HEMI